MKQTSQFQWWMPTIAAVVLAACSVALWAQGQAAAAAADLKTPVQPTHEQIADSLMAHQRYQAAIEEYKKAPVDSADALNKMGVAYQLLYNTAEAGRCYVKAMKLDPHNAVAYNNMGSVYMALKDYSRAEKYFRKAGKLDAMAALYRKNLGTALLAERKYKQGWAEYQQALGIDPDIFSGSGSVRVENPGTIQDRGAMNYYMAKGCLKAGQTNQAIEYLRLALNEGFITPKKVIADAEFASLKDVPAFQKMMAAQGVYLTTPGAHSTIQ
jgi:tetratricopeptide (TPR) repeat protein